MRNLSLRSICSVAIVLSCLGICSESRAEAENARPIVVGFERFFTAPDADLVAAGEFLLSELRCVNCHLPDKLLQNRFQKYPGPKLEGVVRRVRFDYLTRWLASPAKTKPGTTMPHLLAGESEEANQASATALTHFLLSLKSAEPANEAVGSVENGRKLFHTIGCAACHAPEAGFRPATENDGGAIVELKTPSVPLGELAQKYTTAGLRDFLIDPLKTRPSGHMPRTPVSAAEANDLTAYLLLGAQASANHEPPDATLIAKGARLFSDLGCAACHELPGATNPQFKALPDLAQSRERGCLADAPPRGAANYSLSADQRKALRTALEEIKTPKTFSALQQIEQRMMALNCFACHQRDGLGGPEFARTIYFQTSGADLEDEGRFPPPLTGVGRKLTSHSAKGILQGAGSVRPYMTTRMPDFGEQHAEFFGQLFADVDVFADIKPTPRDGNEDQVGRAPWGRELAGVKGLSCISCHDLNGNKSLGIRALDLAFAPQRLRPEWFRDYLIDPARFRPGTRMPSFWPEGKAVHPLLGKNTARQIDSIWVYLNEIDQNRLPDGMEEKGTFELKPAEAPIVFRTFMKEAGFHAIAVGYPQHLNVAFDAEQVRWALAWKGKFLDAEGTWDDRFAPLAAPLGTNVFKFPAGPALPGNHQFRGYRLNAKGVPTFLYQAGAIQVADTLEPDETGKTLRRTLKLHGGSGRMAFGANTEKEIVFDSQGEATLVMEVNW